MTAVGSPGRRHHVMARRQRAGGLIVEIGSRLLEGTQALEEPFLRLIPHAVAWREHELDAAGAIGAHQVLADTELLEVLS